MTDDFNLNRKILKKKFLELEGNINLYYECKSKNDNCDFYKSLMESIEKDIKKYKEKNNILLKKSISNISKSYNPQ